MIDGENVRPRGDSMRQRRSPEDDAFRAAVLIVALLFGAGLFLFLGVFGGIRVYSLVGPQPGPRAAIIDQLSLTAPNPAFAEEATEILEEAGYAVDYYPGEEVTVDFYRDLPTEGYKLVLLRAHAGRVERGLSDEVSLFTSEPYSPTRHVKEQRAGRVGIALFDRGEPEENELYFGIRAEFVTSSMRGDFAGATVVLMGCDVLRGKKLAEAFAERGAHTVVGWDGPVSAIHTDAVTLNLLRHHLQAGLAVQEAAAATMAELGPDPWYESVLISYPRER